MGEGGRVSVILPWSTTVHCPHRQAALEWAMARWAKTGHEVVVGEHAGPWCKASAVEAGLTRATGQVLVVADADVWCDTWGKALDAVTSGRAAWASPHTWVHRLDQRSTCQVLGGEQPRTTMRHSEPRHRAMLGGGLVVLHRNTYTQVRLDARFVGWGGEDEAWARALQVLAGSPWRGGDGLWHLWHPPQERLSRREGSRESSALLRRYRAARTRDQMLALLEETRGKQ